LTDTAINAATAAETPVEIPARGWWEVLKRSWAGSKEDNLNLVAAGVAFYAFLAFVPLLAALVLTYGLVAEPATVVEHFRSLTRVMPLDAARLIGEQLMSMTQTEGKQKGLGLLLALLISLYGSMRGARSIVDALNLVYDAEEGRSFIGKIIVSILITLGGLLALAAAILAISAMGYVERLLPVSSPGIAFLFKSLFWFGAAAAVSLLVAALYRYAPNRPNPRWRWLTPGSIAATAVWLAATLGFGFYVANFGNYNATYGSLGAVIVFLTWLYLSAFILLMGAELNAELEKQTSCDTRES
jgi:membrane protein